MYKTNNEQQAKEEVVYQKISWKKGHYDFLLARTQEKYHLKHNSQKRSFIEKAINKSLPVITDEMLLFLYQQACTKYKDKCYLRYEHAGFQTTPYENKFLETLKQVIKDNPKLKHLEIYPSDSHNSDLPNNFKMVVGNFVPDFLIFGLKIRGSSAVAIEIDGDSHNYKFCKDELKNQCLQELKIFTLEIPNDQVTDIKYITGTLLKLYRLRNGSFNDQIKRVKRKIWTKTISCHLNLREIEELIKEKYDTSLNIEDHFNYNINY